MEFQEISKGMKMKANTFVRNITFLKHWPLEKLNDNPTFCYQEYFSAGKVIVQDSKRADWIYIVKAGKVTVMKKLAAVKENLTENTPRYRRAMNASYKTRKLKKLQNVLPVKLPEVEPPTYKNKADLEIKLEQTLPGLHNPADRLGLIDYEKVENELRATFRPHKVSRGLKLPKLASSLLDSRNSERYGERDLVNLPEINKNTKQGVYLSLPGRVSRQMRKGTGSRSNSLHFRYDEIDLSASSNSVPGELSASDSSFTSEASARSESLTLPEADLSSIFIVVQVLEQGQYFGLSELLFEEQPSLSLVSNGAECILLSKSYFLQHMTDIAWQALRRSEVPFPNEGDLQRKLQEYINWNAHKKLTYNQIIKFKRLRDTKKKQFAPQYIGQYNYRTGPL